MSTSAERFLAAAVRPFEEGSSLPPQIRQALEEGIEPGSADDPSWECAAATLERHDRSWLARHWRKVLVAGTALASIACILPSALEVFRLQQLLKTVPNFFEPVDHVAEQRYLPFLGRHLNSSQQLFLHGDLSKEDPADRMEALWRSQPDNAQYYADYALAHFQEHRTLPPDFSATAVHVDPTNGWFPFFSAIAASSTATEKISLSYKERTQEGASAKWKIVHPDKLSTALADLRRSAGYNDFISYQTSIWEQRIALLPPETGIADKLHRIRFIRNIPSEVSYSGGLHGSIQAQAGQFVANGDREGFKELLHDWKVLSSRQLRDARNVDDVLLAAAFAGDTLRSMHRAAVKLGLDHEAEALQPIIERMDQDRLLRKQRMSETWASYIRNHGPFSSPGYLDDGILSELPHLDTDRLTPARMADQALMDRIFALGGAILLLVITSLLAIYRKQRNEAVRTAAERMLETLTTGDWLLLTIGGVGMPLLYFMAIHFLTPLGGSAWSYAYTTFLMPMAQTLALVLLMVTATATVARWRLLRRLPHWRPESRRSGLQWLSIFSGTITIPLAGMAYRNDGAEAWMIATGICLGIGWLAIPLSLTRKRWNDPGRLTVTNALVPLGMFAALVMLLQMPFHRWREQRWIELDTLFISSGSGTDISVYEHELALARKAEVQEIFKGLGNE